MDKEVAWFFAPVAAILSQIGGTWWRPARWLLISVGLTLTLALCGISVFRAILCGIWLGFWATMPITLFDDEIHEWWQFVWVFCLFYVIGVGSVFIGLSGLLLALVSCIAGGGLATLSNLPTTRKLVPWKFFEALAWMLAVYPYLLLASKS